MATRLPALQKEDEGALLGKMLEELNIKFALQLDLKPSTDRSGQEASDLHDPNDMLNVVFAVAATLLAFLTLFRMKVSGFWTQPCRGSG